MSRARSGGGEGLEAMSAEERHRFCRQVLENLSGLVDGDAPEEFCRKVDETLGECESYLAFRSTFEKTIRMTHELAASQPVGFDEEAYGRCIERARLALARSSGSEAKTHGEDDPGR